MRDINNLRWLKLTQDDLRCWDTMLGHNVETKCRDTMSRHNVETQCRDAMLERTVGTHCVSTFCLDIVSRHCVPTLCPNIVSRQVILSHLRSSWVNFSHLKLFMSRTRLIGVGLVFSKSGFLFRARMQRWRDANPAQATLDVSHSLIMDTFDTVCHSKVKLGGSYRNSCHAQDGQK